MCSDSIADGDEVRTRNVGKEVKESKYEVESTYFAKARSLGRSDIGLNPVAPRFFSLCLCLRVSTMPAPNVLLVVMKTRSPS